MESSPPSTQPRGAGPATLRDVAAAAGVSRSTASRALAGSAAIRPETKAQVLAEAAKLGYRPNVMARGLRTNASRTVGLVLNNLLNNSFHTLAEVQQQFFEKRGYNVLLCVTHDDPEREARYLEMLRDLYVEGLLIVGTGQNSELLRRFESSGIPVVNMIRRAEGAGTDSVLASDEAGAYLATKYLAGLGHRDIAIIVGRRETTSGCEREAGYLRALREAGIPVDGDLVRSGPYTPDFGAVAIDELLQADPIPTAIFVANHEAALGALPLIFARGISVPKDLSIVCYEDVSWFSWWSPRITTVDNRPAEIGELGAELLYKKITTRRARNGPGSRGDPESYGREFRAGSRLLERGSCAAPRAGGPALGLVSPGSTDATH